MMTGTWVCMGMGMKATKALYRFRALHISKVVVVTRSFETLKIEEFQSATLYVSIAFRCPVLSKQKKLSFVYAPFNDALKVTHACKYCTHIKTPLGPDLGTNEVCIFINGYIFLHQCKQATRDLQRVSTQSLLSKNKSLKHWY